MSVAAAATTTTSLTTILRSMPQGRDLNGFVKGRKGQWMNTARGHYEKPIVSE